VFRITNGDTGEPAPNPVTRVLATGRIVGLANHTVLTARDGTRRQVADSAAPILAEDDGIIGVVLVFRDVTEEYAVREALRRSEERYRTLYDSIGDAILITDTTRQILECNEAFCRLFGYESSELVGNTTSAIYASEDEFRSLGSKLATPEPDGFNHVIHFRTKDGRVFPGDTHVFPVTVGDGRIRGFMGIVRDISEQVEAQARIRHLLQDKELLLREVHHRIKNNMNTVAGLLEVQAGHQMPAAAEHQLREARNRILTMMTIYDKLYKSGDFERIDIAGFLTELIREVSESYATEQNAVQVETDIQSFDISSDLSFPLGIIVNELISNAFKYAFPVGTDGLIRVSGVRRSDGTVVVEVADNGVGLSEDQSSGGQSGFGLTLVRGLAAQAQGTVEVVPGTGTTVVVTLPCAAMTPARDVRGS
jgi:PAS domain S-box-containing protein